MKKLLLDRYGEVLMWGLKKARKQEFKKGDIVLVSYDIAAVRLAETMQGKILDAGLNPVLRLKSTKLMEKQHYKKADDKQLVFTAPGSKELFENLDGYIVLRAPESLTHLKHIDPKKMSLVSIANKWMHEIRNKREEQGLFGWTLCSFPTPELAKQARISLKEYTEQIIRACYLDAKNPEAKWEELFQKAAAIKEWLNNMSVDYYHIESENIDLIVTPGEKRKWIGITGHNIPSFELFLSPDWRGTNGVYFANQPSFRSGHYVKGVRLEFQNGSVVDIDAAEGKNFTEEQLRMDDGANKVGEFSLTDKRFSNIDKFMADTLFDENFGGEFGNCRIATGNSYSDTYHGNPGELTKEEKERLGFNNSALHWDLVNTEDKKVTAYLKNGEKIVIYENGMFKN